MTKSAKFYKTTIKAFTLFFCLMAINHASAQGPNAPEAASFEPLDVTDVVNLVTGDLSYTIPTIMIPGPNGGYPLTLSYHAGIAMDQEASWVGLGWSLNPGAINRNVHGFPDDWDNVKSYEYYWNKGEVLTQQTIDVVIPTPSGVTIGLGASWGSLRGFSGTVGFGYAGVNVNISSDGSGSFGYGSNGIGGAVSWSDNGVGVGVGVGGNTTNGQSGSLGIGYHSSEGWSGKVSVSGNYGMGASLSMSSSGTRFSASAGVGQTDFGTTQTINDMTVIESGFKIPLILVNYQYEKVVWYVDRLKELGISGGLYTDNNLQNIPQDLVDYCESQYGPCDYYYDSSNPQSCDCIDANGVGYGYTGTEPNPDFAFADIHEVNYNGDNERYSILNRNPTLINYDGFNVAAQGLAGAMSPKFFKNIALANVNLDYDEADLSYYRPNNNTAPQKANFHFDNELSGGAVVNKVTFNNAPAPSNFDDYINNPTNAVTGDKRSGNFVEYFTYNNIPADSPMPQGYVKPEHADANSIAGFRITSTDGIVYHYMLPVYSLMEKSRAYNIENIERDVYSERTNSSYATHWLLTSITGPDFVDNNTDGRPDEGDFGYWVDFEYGKWSEGFTWRTPGLASENAMIGNQRRYMWGLKELYYIDKISTRTHSALFIKDVREDNIGVRQLFKYKDADYDFTTPSQKQLKLNKIVLVQNSKLPAILKNNAQDLVPNPNASHTFTDPKISKTYNFNTDLQDNVLDSNDAIAANLEQNALKIVSLFYDYQLAQNSPNTVAGGKLTLNKLLIKGKNGKALIPPYRFSYTNNPDWEFRNSNYWGYNNKNAAAWSLSQVTTPQGALLEVEYESDEYWNNSDVFGTYNFKSQFADPTLNNLEIRVDIGNYDLNDGDILYMTYDNRVFDCASNKIIRSIYEGQVQLQSSYVESSNFSTWYSVILLNPGAYSQTQENINGECPENPPTSGGATFSNVTGTPLKSRSHAGIRVAALSVSDNINTYKTTYEYGYGSVPYEAFFDTQGIPNQALLRSPNVLYDQVTVRNLDIYGNPINDVKEVYEFVSDLEAINGISGSKLQSNPSSTTLTNGFNGNPSQADSYDYKDYQGIIGSLKSSSVYQGTTLISKSSNNYVFLDESSGFVNTESTQMYKTVNPKPGSTQYGNINRLISTSYTKYPLVLESSEIIQGGFKKTTFFDKRDINSGAVLETRFFGSDGKEYKNEIVPAYTISEYGAMGSKEDNFSNKNMLVQEAMKKSYLKDNGVWTLLQAGITTWKPWSNDIWRIQKTFTWNGETDTDGLFANYNGVYDSFDWSLNTNQPTNSNWKKLSEVTLYSDFSMPQEILDINGNRASTKMGANDTQVYASGNAGYDELFYSGAEDLTGSEFGGEVGLGTSSTTTAYAHTGSNSLQMNSGETGYVVSVVEGKSSKYKASAWVRIGGETNTILQVAGNNILPNSNETVRAGDWFQLNFYFDITGTQTVNLSSNGGTSYIDDFRLHPLASSMSSYVYNEWDELSYILGANNLGTFYEYDAVGRLIRTSSEVIDFDGPGTGGFRKIGENEYHYKGQNQ